MSKKYPILLGVVFYFFFLLLTPLGIFNDWVPPLTQTGHYSVAVIDPGDDTGYYAYLRSAFFDGDFDFINEGNYAHVEHFTPTGYVFNNWQVGQSILFLPFFLAGHLAAVIYNSLGYAVSVDGYSAPYYMATAVASQTYLFVGLLLLFSILKKRFGGSIALVSTLVIWLGSPLLYYTFIRQRMANTTEFFVAVVFIYFWLKHRNSQDISKHALLGAILGFLCMIRVINSVLLILYLVDQLVLLKQSEPALKVIGCKKILARVFCFSGFWFLAFMPQFFTWYKIGGLPMPAFHVDDTKSMVALFSIEKIIISIRDMLFGYRWGLIFSSPIIIVGFCGLLVSRKKYEIPRLGLVLSVLASVFIVVFFDKYLAAYEYRYLTPIFPAVAIGVAVILKKLSKNTFGVLSAIAFIFVCVLAQYFMLIQYKVTMFHNDPEFTVKALGAIPSLIVNQPNLLLRSTNFIRLIFLDHPQAWDYNDFLFLIIFPLAQMICVVLVVLVLGYAAWWRPFRKTLFQSRYALGSVFLGVLGLIILVEFLAPNKTERETNDRKLCSSLIKKGDLLLSAGNIDGAIGFFKRASTLAPGLWSIYYGIGVAHDSKKELQKANENYRRVLIHNPYHSLTTVRLGTNLLSLGELDDAEFYLKESMRMDPSNKNVYNTLGQLYKRQKKLQEARKMFEIAVAVEPQFGPAHFNLALLWTMLNNYEEAVLHLKEAIKLEVQGPGVLALSKLYKIHE